MTNTAPDQSAPIVPTAILPTATFGQRLVVLRFHLGFTQEQAATQCGMSAATWNTWEHGTSPRNMAEVAARIANTFGVDRTWLTWGPADPGLGGQWNLWYGLGAPSAQVA